MAYACGLGPHPARVTGSNPVRSISLKCGTNFFSNIFVKVVVDIEREIISAINIRPADNNRSMDIEDKNIKKKVEDIIKKLLF